jgi:uncharacterized integral membrane protein (TIGR00697 family)
MALYIFGIVTINLMGAKVMPLGSVFGLTFNISVSIFLVPLLYTIVNVANEVRGRERAQSLIWSGMMVMVLLVLFVMLATSVPAAERFAIANLAYEQIFGLSIRFSIASIVAFASSATIGLLIYNCLRKQMRGKLIWLRNNAANFVSAFVDTTIFVVVAFYSFESGVGDNILWLLGLILPYWLLRCAMSIITTPLAYAGISFLKRRKTCKSKRFRLGWSVQGKLLLKSYWQRVCARRMFRKIQ